MSVDHEALFQEIYEDYYQKVLSYINARVNNLHDAEDLTSNVFLRCYKSIDRYDPERAAVSTWIFTIANNLLKNHYRDSKNNASIDDMEGFEAPYEEDFDQAMRLEEIREYLDRALSELDDTKRQILLMRYYDDMKTKDIAEKLEMSPGNVRVTLTRTINQLNIQVKDDEILQVL